MKLSLIADCGSTKVEWAVIDIDDYKRSEPLKTFRSTGFNAAVSTQEMISQILSNEVEPQIAELEIEKVHFYGAGCIGGEVNNRLSIILKQILPSADVEIASDLLGAARALFGKKNGIACILGTGSNSGLYDGENIIKNTPPMGYILGDEGSGAVLGRLLINYIFKHPGCLSQDIIDDFNATYNVTKAEIIENVYRRPAANRYLASFCPFINKHISDPTIRRIVYTAFLDFFSANLTNYDLSPAKLPIGFIGSIAYHFANILTEAATALGYIQPIILQSPLNSLINYHQQNNL